MCFYLLSWNISLSQNFPLIWILFYWWRWLPYNSHSKTYLGVKENEMFELYITWINHDFNGLLLKDLFMIGKIFEHAFFPFGPDKSTRPSHTQVYDITLFCTARYAFPLPSIILACRYFFLFYELNCGRL